MPSKIRKRSIGKYQFTFSLGYKGSKQITHTCTVEAKNDREAELLYFQYEQKLKGSNPAYKVNLKVREFAEIWYHEHCEAMLQDKTVKSYRNQLDYRILPALGHKEMRKVTVNDIVQFRNGLKRAPKRFDARQKTGVSDRTTQYCFRVLKSMFRYAVEIQVLKDNPCENVRPPKVSRKKIHLPPEIEIRRMIALLQREEIKWRMPMMLAITTGLRLGELTGLKWQDIDLERGLLQVVRTRQAVNHAVKVKDPKTEESRRTISLGKNMVSLLKKYRAWQATVRLQMGTLWHDEGWVLTKYNGEAIYPTSPSQWFSKFLKRNCMEHMSFHALRHLSATIIISQGIPLKNVSARLGHTQISTTADIYADALLSVDKRAGDVVDRFIYGEKVSS